MPESKTAWEQAADWFARTLAIVIVMIAPGALGAWLDSQLETGFLAGLGFVIGMALAIGLLMLFTRIKKIDNDGPIMSGSTTSSRPNSSQPVVSPKEKRSESLGESSSASSGAKLKPSDSPLPKVPGADVFEVPQRDD